MAHWRDTYRPARFFFLDVRAGVFVLAMLVWIRPWTIAIALAAIALAWYLERIGLDVAGAGRALRAWMAGPIRPALPFYKIRRQIDFSRRRLAWEEPALEGKMTIKPLAAPTTKKTKGN
jgi:intracellular multiplication protein IcmT